MSKTTLKTRNNQYVCPLCDEAGALRVAIEAQLAMPLRGAAYSDIDPTPSVFKREIQDELPYAVFRVCNVFCISCGAAIKEVKVKLEPLAHELLDLEGNRE